MTMNKSEEKKLSIKQRKWIKYYIESGNATNAARLAGYDCSNEDSFRVIGSENLAKLNMADLMEEMGLTDVALVNVISEGLTKPVKADITGALHPDYTTRHKYLETALKTKKKLTDQSSETQPINVNIHPAFLNKYADQE